MRPSFSRLRLYHPALIAAALLCAALPVRAAVSVATLGDSYTDEYSPRYQHRSWTEQIMANPSTGVDFGAGNVLHRATSGATVADAVNLQLPQVTSRINQADYVVIDIGLNDLHGLAKHGDGYWRPDRYIAIGRGDVALTATVTNHIVNHITALIDSLRAADPNQRIILSKIPDWGATVSFRRKVIDKQYNIDFGDTGGKANLTLRRTFTRALKQINQQITRYAAARDIPVVNKFALMNRALKEPTIAFTKTQRINTRYHPGYRDEDGGAYAMWADGLHPATAWQGIYANVILDLLREHYGEDVNRLTAQQIMSTYAGGATLPDDDVHPNYRWEDFVRLPDAALIATARSTFISTGDLPFTGPGLAPEPASALLLLMGLAFSARRRTPHRPR